MWSTCEPGALHQTHLPPSRAMTSLRSADQFFGSSDERFDFPDDQPVRVRFGIGTGDGLGLGTGVSPHSAGRLARSGGFAASAGVEVEAGALRKVGE